MYSPAENARLLAQYEKIGRNPIRIMYKRNIHETPEGCNIFVKNIDQTVSFKELHNLFAQVGNVVTVKIATNTRGESLGYGYVLMEKKEDADLAIQKMNGYKLKEKEITCNEFQAKEKRMIRGNNNLYIKGLPTGVSKEEIQKKLEAEFSKFGKIISLAAQQSRDEKWFAFVCFEDANAAEEAIKTLNNSNIFGSEPLFVARHQSRHERDFEFKKNYANMKNDINLFLKNLKPEVTKENIRQAFSEFGEVGNTSAFTKALKPDDTRTYGFVSFKKAQDALRAQTEGPKSDEVKKLFIDGQDVYIYWPSKAQRDQSKDSERRPPFDQQRSPISNIPTGTPFQMPTNMRTMNFPPFPMMNFSPFPMMNPIPDVGAARPQNLQRGGGYQQRRGAPYQGGYRPAGPRTHQPTGGYQKQQGKPQQQTRPGQRTDYHAQPTQHVQPKEVHLSICFLLLINDI